MPDAPRLRILVDLDRLATVDESGAERAVGADALTNARITPRSAAADEGPWSTARALATLSRLAGEGRIVLCRVPSTWNAALATTRGRPLAALLGAAPFESVEPAVDRSFLDPDVFGADDHPGASLRFCRRLKTWRGTLERLPPEAVARLPATTRRGLESLDRYCDIAARTQGERLVDLFNLWSGELAHCRFLLTLDDRLAEFVERWVRPHVAAPLECHPVTPDALLRTLGVADRDALAGATAALFSLGERRTAAPPRDPA